ncbi:TPA: hypothetical protein PXJ35_002435 [Yersinia enterocolitica]|nr:hypothetical protein [Yersinia enterocolitica]HDL6655580.1 hypothetical protein [Yersinia enterocolitica]HDL6682308.1 hypothetical protein [Yersinia enterocolitica]
MVVEKALTRENQPKKVVVRRWRKVAIALVWILLLGGCLAALDLYLDGGNDIVLSNELQQIKVPLFFWRLTLYYVVILMWFHRVRGTLLHQAPSPAVIYRLELMMVCLALLIEFTSYRWGM